MNLVKSAVVCVASVVACGCGDTSLQPQPPPPSDVGGSQVSNETREPSKEELDDILRQYGLEPSVADPRETLERLQREQAIVGPLRRRQQVNSIGMQFKLIAAGKFIMGEGDQAHEVTQTKPFKIGVHEVTQAQYEQVMGVNPSEFKGTANPVETVNWDDAVEFCRKLSELPAEKAAGNVYRLPTEAEWDYACRAGTTTKYSFGDNAWDSGDYHWSSYNADDKTHPVGGKKPNAWGLYDMHGNVSEWCQDWYCDYPSGTVTDPTGFALGLDRVRRGGSWGSFIVQLSAYRNRQLPSYRSNYGGFRVSLSPSGK